MVNGYENCYLKNSTSGSTTARDGVTRAIRRAGGDATGNESDSSSGNGDSTNSGDSSSPGSKAWIAGPVVGAVVAIVVILLAFMLWRRRRRNSKTLQERGGSAGHGTAYEQEPWLRQELETTAIEKPPMRRYKPDSATEVQELDTPERQRVEKPNL